MRGMRGTGIMPNPPRRIWGGMADMRDMTVAQARTFEEIIAPLRGRGFDEQGLGVRSSNLHIERRDGALHFSMDFLNAQAHGMLDADGRGVWWLRSGLDGDGQARRLGETDRRGTNGGIRVRLGFLDVCRRHGRTAETVFQASGTVIEFPGFLKATADDDRLQH